MHADDKAENAASAAAIAAIVIAVPVLPSNAARAERQLRSSAEFRESESVAEPRAAESQVHQSAVGGRGHAKSTGYRQEDAEIHAGHDTRSGIAHLHLEATGCAQRGDTPSVRGVIERAAPASGLHRAVSDGLAGERDESTDQKTVPIYATYGERRETGMDGAHHTAADIVSRNGED